MRSCNARAAFFRAEWSRSAEWRVFGVPCGRAADCPFSGQCREIQRQAARAAVPDAWFARTFGIWRLVRNLPLQARALGTPEALPKIPNSAARPAAAQSKGIIP